MSAHVTSLLALAAAGGLDASEAERVAAHLRECAACAARHGEWEGLADVLRRLPPPRPSPDLLARTRAAVETRIAERAEQIWKPARRSRSWSGSPGRSRSSAGSSSTWWPAS